MPTSSPICSFQTPQVSVDATLITIPKLTALQSPEIHEQELGLRYEHIYFLDPSSTTLQIPMIGSSLHMDSSLEESSQGITSAGPTRMCLTFKPNDRALSSWFREDHKWSSFTVLTENSNGNTISSLPTLPFSQSLCGYQTLLHVP